jgi:hypothetical protein
MVFLIYFNGILYVLGSKLKLLEASIGVLSQERINLSR